MITRTFLSVFVAAGVVLTACGSDDNGASTSATTAPAAAVTTSSSTSSVATGDATLMIATDPTLGEHLVDGQGRTLYLFEQDQGTTTACTGGCADNWPPIVANGTPTAGEGIDAAELATADGIEPNQITYHGHLLYYFAGDQAAGDTNGIGIPDWYAVDPAGNAIETG
jgi:predicted lipoprotein with Yx(FWY)xxD motif